MINDLDIILSEGESHTSDSIIEFFQSEGRVRYDDILRDDLPVAEKFDEGAYRKFIRLAGISEVIDRGSILKNLKCAGDANGQLCFTNAGALFFRKNDEDIEFRHAGVVCALYKGINKVYILDVKELNGDIMSKVDDAVVFLKKHLRMSYKIVSVRRENILELPEDALREAVVNAVCHRDYFEKGARTMVEVFDDRVDIVSPGSVCKGITPENFGTVSITRNSTLATLLHRSDYIEQMGTGIERMRNAARVAQVAEPEFEFSGFFKVTFRRNPVDFSTGNQAVTNRSQAVASGTQAVANRSQAVASGTQAVANRSQAVANRSQAVANRSQAVASGTQAVASGTQAVVKTDRKRDILAAIEMNGKASSTEMAEILGLTTGRIRVLLRELVNDGTIKKIGDNRYTYYVLK